ncbi:hypothetical protein HPP92_026741 [Vanilla planifolia]|uniref:Uncharacterized protein n=1 Tax=Vanilla planifolia TaxID=51239 RepID=A0A835PE06_VANPL|nr:hypothetical protein HPP92_026741 [Vanilla planifolia]
MEVREIAENPSGDSADKATPWEVNGCYMVAGAGDTQPLARETELFHERTNRPTALRKAMRAEHSAERSPIVGDERRKKRRTMSGKSIWR